MKSERREKLERVLLGRGLATATELSGMSDTAVAETVQSRIFGRGAATRAPRAMQAVDHDDLSADERRAELARIQAASERDAANRLEAGVVGSFYTMCSPEEAEEDMNESISADGISILEV